MSGSSTPPRTLREDIDQLCRVVRRSTGFWRRTLGVIAVAAIVTALLVLKTPPVYRSETLILYQEAIHSSDLTGAESGSENARRAGARLREALLSRASLEPIVADLHLFPTAGADRHDLVEAVEETRAHILFKAREGDTFAIAFDGTTPEEAQEVTQRLADRIVQYAASRRSEHAMRLKEFLDAESTRNEATLKAKEAAFAQFLAAHPELALAAQPDMRTGARPAPTAPAPSAARVDPELVALEVRASRIEQKLAGSRAAARATPAPSAATTVAAPAADGPEVLAARRELADKLLRFTDRHPDVLQARARLDALEAAQAAARAAEAAAAQAAQAAAAEAAAAAEPASEPVDETERATLQRTLDDLRRRIAARRGSAAAVVEPASASSAIAEVEFFRLQRELGETRDRQRQLDDRTFKASMMATLVADDRNVQVSVLDPAYLPTRPISRSRRMLVAGGLLVGVLVAMLTALVSARLDDRLHERADIEELGIVPLVAVIPRDGTRRSA